jgi:hypothetical protein
LGQGPARVLLDEQRDEIADLAGIEPGLGVADGRIDIGGPRLRKVANCNQFTYLGDYLNRRTSATASGTRAPEPLANVAAHQSTHGSDQLVHLSKFHLKLPIGNRWQFRNGIYAAENWKQQIQEGRCCVQNSATNATSLTCGYVEHHLVLPGRISI